MEPDFQILDQIVLNDVQDVFAVDALESSHPISVDVNDPKDINELFDRISYGKGVQCSVMHLFHPFSPLTNGLLTPLSPFLSTLRSLHHPNVKQIPR